MHATGRVLPGRALAVQDVAGAFFARQSWHLLRVPPTALRLAHALTAETWQECRLVLRILADRAVWDAFESGGAAPLELRPPLSADPFGPGSGTRLPGLLHSGSDRFWPGEPAARAQAIGQLRD